MEKVTTDCDLAKKLLLESLTGSMMGIRIDDSMLQVEQRCGPPDDWTMDRTLLRYGLAQVMFAPDQTVWSILVEVPDECALFIDDFASTEAIQTGNMALDSSQSYTRVGWTKIGFDTSSRLIRSFSLMNCRK